MDLKHHLIRQMAFSHATFGPGNRREGVIDHIRKELDEIEQSEGDIYEWVDVIILALDGISREISFGETTIRTNPHIVAERVCDAIDDKLTSNESRSWPDWRTADPSRAIEHNKD